MFTPWKINQLKSLRIKEESGEEKEKWREEKERKKKTRKKSISGSCLKLKA